MEFSRGRTDGVDVAAGAGRGTGSDGVVDMGLAGLVERERSAVEDMKKQANYR